MKQKYVSDPFVHVSLTDKRDRSTHCRTKSVGAYTKEQKKTSVMTIYNTIYSYKGADCEGFSM